MQFSWALFNIVTFILGKALGAEEAASLQFKEQCLKWHNEFRERHQVGPVTWSDELARGAKSWADYLAENETLEHAPNLQLGENLYQSGMPPPKEPCTEATKLFYGEVKNYDFDKPGFSANTGHFTQLVWKKSKQIGAAYAIRTDGFVVVVVRYSPPGNFNNAYKENVFPEPKDSAGIKQTRSSLVFVSFAVVALNVFF